MANLNDLINGNSNLKLRTELEPQFSTGEIPTQADFFGLIHNMISRKEDGIFKDAEYGLCIAAGEDDDKSVLLLYEEFDAPAWTIGINNGLHIKDKDGNARLSILSDGKVGIGTETPREKLHVKGNIYFEGNNLISKTHGNPAIKDHIWHDENHFSSGRAPGTWHFGSKSRLRDKGNSRLYAGHVYMVGDDEISYFAGKVGIGNDRGNATLTVKGRASDPSILIEGDNISSTMTMGLRLNNGSNSWIESNGDLLLQPQNGNVGIGTDAPDTKLHVKGNQRIEGSTLEIGSGLSGNRYAYVDLTGDDTHVDYGLRLIRGNTGANTFSQLSHRGTGNLYLNAYDAGNVVIRTNNTDRVRIEKNSGDLYITGAITSPEGRLRDNGGGWVRTYGNTGWYNGTHGGGWYMNDSTWIKSYNNKDVLINKKLRADEGFEVGPNGDKFKVKSNGFVGIGTNNPAQELTIIANSTNNVDVRLQNNSGHAFDIFSGSSRAGLWVYGPRSLEFATNGNEKMRIQSNGTVGIGTNAPLTKLQIDHDGASTFGTALFINQYQEGNHDGPKIQFRKKISSSAKNWAIGIKNGANVRDFIIEENGGYTGFGTTRFIVKNGGNVGIGTASPAHKLHVNGSVQIDNNTYINRVLNVTHSNASGHVMFITNEAKSNNADGLAIYLQPNTFPFATSNNNFITFRALHIVGNTKNERNVGAIEGTSNGGVTLTSGNADFAEYIPLNPVDSYIRPSSVLGVKNGKGELNTQKANHITVSSDSPIVSGNWPGRENEKDYVKAAFIGQTKTKIIGKVNFGDYIFPSGNNDGVGVAISPDKALDCDISKIAGVAWESSEEGNEKLINTFVNIPIYNRLLQKMLERIKYLEHRIEQINLPQPV